MKFVLTFLILIYTLVTTTAQVDFLKNPIDTLDVPADVFPYDLDQDGDIDIIGSGLNNGQVIWYENQGNQKFERNVLLGDTADERISVGDLDGDGGLDLVTMTSPSFGPGKLTWFKNDGAENFEAIEIGTSCDVEESKIVDLDGDGDLDIVGITACGNDDKVLWWRNDNLTFIMEELVVTSNAFRSVEIIDFDFDGDLDFVLPIVFADEVAWYENNGSESFQKISINAGPEIDGVDYIEVIDLDDDGDYEVICANTSAGTITYSNKTFAGDYEIITIDTEVANPGFIKATDLDFDGDLDLVAADKGFSGPYLWYENDGNNNFERRQIAENVVSSLRLYLVDFDHDLDQDFIGWSSFPRQLNWWENTFCVPLADTIDLFLCEGEPVTYNGVVYDTDGVFILNNQSQNGCDSSQIIEVVSSFSTGPLDYSIEDNIITLQNVGSLAEVNWIDCDTQDTIAVIEGPSYMPPYDGNFSAIILDGICNTGVNCIEYMFVSSVNNQIENDVKIYPNPATGEVYLSGTDLSSLQEITVRNMFGAVMEIVYIQNGSLDLMKYVAGIYLLDFELEGQRIIKKVVLN